MIYWTLPEVVIKLGLQAKLFQHVSLKTFLTVAIKAAHARGRDIYGPFKIQTELAAQGVMAGINRIKRLRTLHGIRCTHKKKFRVTTDSKHYLPVAPNLLDRQFTCTAPNQVWVADITYIPTGETVKVFTAHLNR